ncbi:MAG: hypothetical protein RSD74_02190 [Angelakisella sp.]
MEQTTNKIYASGEGGKVTRFFSSVFETPKASDILVEEGNEDCHAHVHLKYQALDEQGCHNYKVVGGAVVPTTAEEKATELAERLPAVHTPTIEERLAAIEAIQLEQILGGAV